MTITAIDGRPLYFIPHEHTTILGTTDDDYFGDQTTFLFIMMTLNTS